MPLLLSTIAIYLTIGAMFAIPFSLRGAAAIDPAATHSSWGFRLLLLPGAAALWPLLALRWARARRIAS